MAKLDQNSATPVSISTLETGTCWDVLGNPFKHSIAMSASQRALADHFSISSQAP